MQGAFVTVVPGRFGFVTPDRGDLGNLYVTAGTLAALPRAPHRGDRARFKPDFNSGTRNDTVMAR